MTLVPFNDGWAVLTVGTAPRNVTIPHDAMLSARRSASAPSRYNGAWFHGERYTYEKRWVPDTSVSGGRVSLVFEGVQRASAVWIDGTLLAENRNGYREFEVELTDQLRRGGPHLLTVVADSRQLPNGRWYSGAGIYRPVWLRVTGQTRLARDGVMVTTRLIRDRAHVDVVVEVESLDVSSDEPHGIEAIVLDGGRAIARAHSSVTQGQARIALTVPNPRLWSDAHPALYHLDVVLRDGDRVVDRSTVRFGIRTISIDPTRGLLLNGARLKLRGGNIHHDNGVLGAVSTPAAERRRVRVLKAVGYNAIRSAHNPMSRALLDACDEGGLLVVDELTDVWWDPKTRHDDSSDFESDWHRDLTSMVRRDRIHPSVFAYSIGNENGETGTKRGIEQARAMRDLARRIDDTRPVTAGVNLGMTSAAAARARRKGEPPHDPATPKKPLMPPLDSTTFNILFATLRPYFERAAKRGTTDRGITPIFNVLDLAGYNYGISRYLLDLDLHPDRIIFGSETMPGDIARVWPIVETNPRVIGDFVWSAWDYLGETGIGTWTPGKRFATLMKRYPALVAGPGIIDITGVPTAQALLARAAWGITDEPGLAVRPIHLAGLPTARAAWRSTDAIQSWSWRGCDGVVAQVEVYSAAEEVDLLLNGKWIARKAAGHDHGFVARFRVPYAPGTLLAIALRDGKEVGRSELRSATGALRLHLVSSGGDGAMEFVEINIADEDGTVEMLADAAVTVAVAENARLAALGSAAPSTTESFVTGTATTYYGRALAVVGEATPTDDLTGTLHVRSPTLGEAAFELGRAHRP